MLQQEEEVDNLKESIQTHEDQKSDKQKAFDKAQQEVEEAENKFKVIEQEMRNKAEGGEPLKDELGQVQNEIEQAKSHKKHYENKHKEQEKKIGELKKKMESYKGEIEVKYLVLRIVFTVFWVFFLWQLKSVGGCLFISTSRKFRTLFSRRPFGNNRSYFCLKPFE